MIKAEQTEPPSWARPPVFMIGQDGRGNWVVKDQNGTRGGLFVDRDAALRFVRAENGYRPRAVVMVSEVLELEMNDDPPAPAYEELAADLQRLRRTS